MAKAAQSADAVKGDGLARRPALRPRAEGAPARRRARRRAWRFDGLHYVKSVTHRSSAASTSRASRSAATADLDHADGPGGDRAMTTRRTTASTAARSSTTSTRSSIGRIQALVPDVLGLDARRPGRCPCVPVAGTQRWASTSVPPIGRRRVDRVRAAATPTTRSGSAASGARRRGPGLAPDRRARPPEHRPADLAADGDGRQRRCPGPTGGIMLQERDRRHDRRQRHRHLHPERQGRDDRN